MRCIDHHQANLKSLVSPRTVWLVRHSTQRGLTNTQMRVKMTSIFCVTLMTVYAAAKRSADILPSKLLFFGNSLHFANCYSDKNVSPSSHAFCSFIISFVKFPLYSVHFPLLSSPLLTFPCFSYLSFPICSFLTHLFFSFPLIFLSSCSFIPQPLSIGISNLGSPQTAMWMYNSFT